MNVVMKPPKKHAEWTGGFWKQRWDVCRDHMVPHMWDVLNDAKVSHCWQNFLIAVGEAEGNHSGPPFHDGDLYKWLEAASRVYGNTDNKEWNDRLDYIIDIIARVQRDDGYIFTYDAIQKRNSGHYEALANDLNFEVYNLGHLMSAGVMHHTMTGKTTLLACAEKAAGYLASQFSDLDHARARTAICPSHYMGLAQLHTHTGNEDYLELLETLILLRDRVPNGTDDNQDRTPLKQQREIVGHGVRSTYLYAGLTDLYMEKADEDYRTVLESVWNDLVSKKIYITGGCGALYDGISPYGAGNTALTQNTHQAFGRAYELPNTAGYNETCASVGNYLWNYRMAQAFGEGKYGDYMERALYNSILSGIDLDGDAYFYTNALRCVHDHDLPWKLKWSRHREPYLRSFCCPPNVVRTVAGTPDKICIPQDNGVTFLIYGDCRVGLELENGAAVEFKMSSDYPWDGEIELIVERAPGEAAFPVKLRIPEWAGNHAVSLNGKAEATQAKGGFVTINRIWKAGDRIALSLPMDVAVMESHPMAEESRNHVAITRGPVVYCLETADLPEGCEVGEIYIDPKAQFTFEKSNVASADIGVLKGELWVHKAPNWSPSELYRSHGAPEFAKIEATLVPYFAWDNRERGEMTVWLPLLPRN